MMTTRKLLEDIRHELISNLSEEKVRVFGLTIDVVKSYEDRMAMEYTFDVNYKGKEIGYYHTNGDEDEPDYIEAYSRNSNGDSTDEYDEHSDAVEWIVSSALEDDLISEGVIDKAKQMAMKFLKKAKSKMRKRFNWSKDLKQAAKKKGKKVR